MFWQRMQAGNKLGGKHHTEVHLPAQEGVSQEEGTSSRECDLDRGSFHKFTTQRAEGFRYHD